MAKRQINPKQEAVAEEEVVVPQKTSEAGFPVKKKVTNNSPITAFFTSIMDIDGATVILRGNTQQNTERPNATIVEFQSQDELTGFKADCLAYETANGFNDAILIEDLDSKSETE